MYILMYVPMLCMFVFTYVHMYVCMYVCTYVCMHVCTDVWTYGCMFSLFPFTYFDGFVMYIDVYIYIYVRVYVVITSCVLTIINSLKALVGFLRFLTVAFCRALWLFV